MILTKILSLFLCFCLILEQGVFAQTIDLSRYFARGFSQTISQSDKFRPLHLRYISYDGQTNDFQVLLDKGDFFNQKTPKLPNASTPKLEEATQELMKYFFIGLSLPNEKFWVNLRPDSPDNILDPLLEKTDIGRIFLEADLQLKKDTSGMTSPQTPEGKAYWDKLYKKAGELFDSQNITIPTITRPWIVPAETIIGESSEGAYIYKATLKVMLEEDYLTSRGGSRTAPTYQQSVFSDPRLKELNEYSTQLIREAIIPKLTYEVNTSKRYAPLRQVYYSLILAQWFKEKYSSSGSVRASGISAPVNSYIDLIDSGNLANLTSKEPYDKQSYFQQYQKSFQDGEYNLQEPVYTAAGQIIRRYVSGGMLLAKSVSSAVVYPIKKTPQNKVYLLASEAASPLNSVEETARELTEALFDPNRANERLFLWENTLTPKIFKQIVKNITTSLGDKEHMLQQLILRIITDSAEMKNTDENISSKPQNMLFSDIVNGYVSEANKHTQTEYIIFENSATQNDVVQNHVPNQLISHIREYFFRFGSESDAFSKLSETAIGIKAACIKEGIAEETFMHTLRICYLLYEIHKNKLTNPAGIKQLIESAITNSIDELYIYTKTTTHLYLAKTWQEREELIRYPKKGIPWESNNAFIKIPDAQNFLHQFEAKTIYKSFYILNSSTGNDLWIILAPDGFSIGWFDNKIQEFLWDNYRFDGNLVTNENDPDESYIMPSGEIDLSRFTNNEGIKRLLASSAAAAEPKKPYTDITKAVLSKIIKRNEELGRLNQKERENNMVENWLSDYLLRLELLSALLPEEIKTIFYPLLGDDPWPALFWEVIGTNKKAHGGAMPIMSDAMAKQRLRESQEAINSAGLNNRQIKPVTIFNVDNFNYNEYFSYIKNVDALLIKGLSEYTKEYQDHSMAIKTALAGKPVDDYARVIKDKIKEFIRRLNNDIIKDGKYIIIAANEQDMWIGDFIKEALGYIDLLNQPSYADIKTALDKYNLTITTYKDGRVDILGGYLSIRILQKPVFSAMDSDKGGIDFSRPEIITRPISDLQSLAGGPWAINPDLDFEGEWRGIQMVFNSGIRPSARRLAEFAASAASSPGNSQRLEDLRGLVADLLRRDEEDEKPAPADPALKELLAIL